MKHLVTTSLCVLAVLLTLAVVYSLGSLVAITGDFSGDKEGVQYFVALTILALVGVLSRIFHEYIQ